jgi:hypothetical protein
MRSWNIVRGLFVGSMRYSTVGSLGLSTSPADSKKVVAGGADTPSESSDSSCPVVALDFEEDRDAELAAEASSIFSVWLLW